MNPHYRGRLGLQQRVLPSYRIPFFDLLAQACEGGLSILAGEPQSDEGIVTGTPRIARYWPARNTHILRGAFYLCHQRGLAAWLDHWNPDALIMEANPRYLATSAAVRWMHARGRPVIGWGLGAPPIQGAGQALRSAPRARFLKQFDALISYSRRGAREYVDSGILPDRVFTATNAVEPRPSRRPQRNPLSGPASILFVGRLQARKRVDFLLRACSELPEPRPALVIVGDGPERPRLESLGRRVCPTAEFVGARQGAELDPYFDSADLFILPGTGGLAVQQAMAHALPVIVARGDGTQDDLVREANGWQIAPEDYPALVAAIRTALSDGARLRAMGDESYRIVSEEINIESMVQVFVEGLNRLGLASP